MLALVGTLVLAALATSLVASRREKTIPAYLQLLGAALLGVMVLTHVAEAFRLLPEMGWGGPHSAGHYLDFVSAIAGLILFPSAYLWRMLRQR